MRFFLSLYPVARIGLFGAEICFKKQIVGTLIHLYFVRLPYAKVFQLPKP